VLAAYGTVDADVLCLCGIDGYFVPLRLPRSVVIEAAEPSWRDVVGDWLREQRGPVRVADLYAAFARHRKAQANPNWKAKLRQTLQRGAGCRVARDKWVAKEYASGTVHNA
jgi:hypothetical protein